MAIKTDYADVAFNLNELFSFTYNLDGLKAMMEFLYNNQRNLNDKVTVLEERQYSKQQDCINPVDWKLNTLFHSNNENDQNDKARIKKDTNQKQEEQKKSNDIVNTHQSQFKMNNSNSRQLIIDQSSIDKRIKSLESKLTSIQNSIQSIESHQIFQTKTQEELNSAQIKSDLVSLKEKETEIDAKLMSIDAILDELNVKVCDFDIYEIFKDTKTDNGDINIAETLIRNLEQKTFKKFSIMDDKLKQIEVDFIKSKSNLANIKSQLEGGTFTINTRIDHLLNNQKQLNNNYTETTTKFDEIINQMTSIEDHFTTTQKSFQIEINQLRQLNTDLGKKIEGLNSKVNAISSANNILLTKENYITEQQLIKLKESLLKKLNDLETKINDTNPIERLKSIDKTIDNLNKNIEMNGSKTDIIPLNEKLISIMNQMEYLKESESNTNNSIDKISKDINSHHNKLDLLQSWLETIKVNSNNCKITKRDFNLEQNNKYLEMNTFNEYMKVINKEKEKSHKEMEDMYSLINGITNDIKSKANEIDMKQIEEYLIGIIDELKKNIRVQYAEKIEINKRYRIIEQQIKYVIENQMKKNEMGGEKWLLAKKPVNGHNCASCDTYLGDLNQSNEYIYWNKIPVKETNDAFGYRV